MKIVNVTVMQTTHAQYVISYDVYVRGAADVQFAR